MFIALGLRIWVPIGPKVMQADIIDSEVTDAPLNARYSIKDTPLIQQRCGFFTQKYWIQYNTIHCLF